MFSFLTIFILFLSTCIARDDDIRFCSVGLGHFGQIALKIALKKNVNLVAAFTRSSHVGEDVGDVLDLGFELNIKVSPISDMDNILKQTKPNICIDATATTLSEIYDHFVILMNNKVNIISLAEQHIFPFDDKHYESIKQLAIINNVTVFGSGYQDLYFQQYFLALSSSMISITAVDAGWFGDFNKGALAYASYAGIGLSEEEFYEKKINDPQENIFSRLMSEWIVAITKWYAKLLGVHHDIYEVTIEPMMNDGYGVFAVVVDSKVERGYNLGINITIHMTTHEGVNIYFRNELKCYDESSRARNIEIAFYGEPEVRKVVVPHIDIENGTIIPAINRIPQVIDATAGYYNVEQLGLAKFWNVEPSRNNFKGEL